MGNSAWGHGYHEGYGDGAKTGSLITAGAAAVVLSGVWAFRKFQGRRAATTAAVTEPESLAPQNALEDSNTSRP